MARDSIVFYRSFYEAIKELPSDVQAQIYNSIFEYSLNLNEVLLEGLPKTIFTLIKPQLDANNKRYENGKTGGRSKQNKPIEEPKKNQTITKAEPKPNQKVTKTEPNDNVNDNDNDNDNVNESKGILQSPDEKILIPDHQEPFPKRNFYINGHVREPVIPTFDEVHHAFLQNGGKENMARAFFNSFEATGWFSRGSPIRNFSNLVYSYIENWNKNEKNGTKKHITEPGRTFVPDNL